MAEFILLSFTISSIVHIMDHKWDPQTEGGSESYTEIWYEAHIENGLTAGFFAAAVFIVVCLTIDRYLAICHPTFYLQHRIRRKDSVGNSPYLDVALAFICGQVLNYNHEI